MSYLNHAKKCEECDSIIRLDASSGLPYCAGSGKCAVDECEEKATCGSWCYPEKNWHHVWVNLCHSHKEGLKSSSFCNAR